MSRPRLVSPAPRCPTRGASLPDEGDTHMATITTVLADKLRADERMPIARYEPAT